MLVLLGSSATHDARAAYRGQNGRVAIASTRDGGGFQLYVMDPDGTNAVRLTNSTGSDVEPAWSPDGTQVVFDRTRDGNRDIYLINADGTGERRLTTDPAIDMYPTWSADGASVAFQSNRRGNFDIFTVGVDGTDERQITTNLENDRFPVGAPGGTRLAFASVRDGNEDIYVMRFDGSGLRRLTDHPAIDTQPAWAPHGNVIGFISLRTGNRDIFSTRSWRPSAVTQLTTMPSNEFGLAYSPDGTQILFTSDAEVGCCQIWIMGADGSGPTRITSPPATTSIRIGSPCRNEAGVVSALRFRVPPYPSRTRRIWGVAAVHVALVGMYRRRFADVAWSRRAAWWERARAAAMPPVRYGSATQFRSRDPFNPPTRLRAARNGASPHSMAPTRAAMVLPTTPGCSGRSLPPGAPTRRFRRHRVRERWEHQPRDVPHKPAAAASSDPDSLRCHRRTRASTSTMSHQLAVSRGLPQTAPGLAMQAPVASQS